MAKSWNNHSICFYEKWKYQAQYIALLELGRWHQSLRDLIKSRNNHSCQEMLLIFALVLSSWHYQDILCDQRKDMIIWCYDDGCDVKESDYGAGGVFLLVLPSFLHHYLQFPSGWVKLKTKYDRGRRRWRNLLPAVQLHCSKSPPLMPPIGKWYYWKWWWCYCVDAIWANRSRHETTRAVQIFRGTNCWLRNHPPFNFFS